MEGGKDDVGRLKGPFDRWSIRWSMGWSGAGWFSSYRTCSSSSSYWSSSYRLCWAYRLLNADWGRLVGLAIIGTAVGFYVCWTYRLLNRKICCWRGGWHRQNSSTSCNATCCAATVVGVAINRCDSCCCEGRWLGARNIDTILLPLIAKSLRRCCHNMNVAAEPGARVASAGCVTIAGPLVAEPCIIPTHSLLST